MCKWIALWCGLIFWVGVHLIWIGCSFIFGLGVQLMYSMKDYYYYFSEGLGYHLPLHVEPPLSLLELYVIIDLNMGCFVMYMIFRPSDSATTRYTVATKNSHLYQKVLRPIVDRSSHFKCFCTKSDFEFGAT